MESRDLKYRVAAIPESISSEVRQTLISPQYKSLDAIVSVANGYGPCRSCLRVFEQGSDRRIYLTYNPFDGLSSLPDPGPIFIHEDECERFIGEGFPPDILELPILLEAFSNESRLVSREAMDPLSVDDQITDLFEDDEVRFINLRNSEAGCFIARVERLQSISGHAWTHS